MSVQVVPLSIAISPRVRPVLESMAGETPDQKITNLLLNELRRNLEACDKELLDFEVKYGLEHADFARKLAAGKLGNEFGYDLEMDAMRWQDRRDHWTHSHKSLGRNSSSAAGLLSSDDPHEAVP